MIKGTQRPVTGAYPSQGITEARRPLARAREVQQQLLEIQAPVQGRMPSPCDGYLIMRTKLPPS